MLEDRENQAQPIDDGETEDLELLARINRGDREAFRRLYAKYYHPLQRFIYSITHSMDLAEEGINDVMLVVWRNGRSFAGRSRVRTWIMGIGYRKGLKLAEAANRWTTRFKAKLIDNWNELSTAGDEPSTDVELADLLEHSLRRLSVKHRAVVELTYRYGYSYEEIATIVDCPVNTVKTRMFHARAKLEELASELFNDEPGGKRR